MSQDHLVNSLKKFGLDEKEARLYLACLEFGAATAVELARKSRLKRPTVYLIAQALKEKGLLSQFGDKRGIRFSATPPQRLLEEAKDREQSIQFVMPELSALIDKQQDKPKVRFYEGKEGVLAVCEDTLAVSNSEILFTSSLTDIYRLLSPTYDDQVYIPTRLEKHISIRALVAKEPRTMQHQKRDKEQLRSVRFLPIETKFTTTQFIYQTKVAYISPGPDPIGVIIESKEISEMERQKFELLWRITG